MCAHHIYIYKCSPDLDHLQLQSVSEPQTCRGTLWKPTVCIYIYIYKSSEESSGTAEYTRQSQSTSVRRAQLPPGQTRADIC